jgi:hypothetical protein
MKNKNIYNVTGIYLIHNTVSNKSYIGSAKNIYRRIFGKSSVSHLKSLSENRHHNTHLQSAYNKYGVSAFTFDVLEVCDKQKLIEREQFFLDTLLCAKDKKQFADKAYNICPIAGSCLGRSLSDITKEKIAKAHIGEKNSMYGKTGDKHPKSIPIAQYSSTGIFIAKFSNVPEASRILKINHKSIRSALRNGHSANGFYWSLYKDETTRMIIAKEPQKKSFKATCIVTGIILHFNSLTEAAAHFKIERNLFSTGIRKARLKKHNIYKDFIWEKII